MAGIDAFGTKWSISTDGGTTFTDVAEVVNIDVLDASADTKDVSSHDSPNGWREFIGTLKDAGQLSFDINYDPALHGTLLDAISVSQDHKITLPDAGAATVAFTGIITGFKVQAPYDDKLAGSCTVKVSGAPTITP